MGFVLAIAMMATAGAMFANTSQLAHSQPICLVGHTCPLPPHPVWPIPPPHQPPHITSGPCHKIAPGRYVC
jgi:hypothetical protein